MIWQSTLVSCSLWQMIEKNNVLTDLKLYLMGFNIFESCLVSFLVIEGFPIVQDRSNAKLESHSNATWLLWVCDADQKEWSHACVHVCMGFEHAMPYICFVGFKLQFLASNLCPTSKTKTQYAYPWLKYLRLSLIGRFQKIYMRFLFTLLQRTTTR